MSHEASGANPRRVAAGEDARMPHPATPLPPDLPDHFRSAQARGLGVSAGRLGAADLDRPFHGVRTRAAAADATPANATTSGEAPLARDAAARAAILARVRAHRLVLPAHAFYIGMTACAVHGLPLAADAAQRPLEVAVLAPHRSLRRPGIHAIQVRADLVRVVEIDGIRAGSPASLWALAGHRATRRDLVVLGDAIVRIPRGRFGAPQPHLRLATPQQLDAALAAGRRRGAPALREALGLVRVGSMSPLETDVRLALHDAGVAEPVLDLEVRDAAGRLLGISDAAYPAARLALEVEGDHHRTSRAQWQRDIEKHAAYAAAGWETLRLTSTHLAAGRVAALVRTALARRS